MKRTVDLYSKKKVILSEIINLKKLKVVSPPLKSNLVDGLDKIKDDNKTLLLKTNTGDLSFSNKKLTGKEIFLNPEDRSYFEKFVILRSIFTTDRFQDNNGLKFDYEKFQYFCDLILISRSLNLPLYFNWINSYFSPAHNYINQHKGHPSAKHMFDKLQQSYVKLYYPRFNLNPEKTIYSYDDADSQNFVVGTPLQKKFIYALDSFLQKSDFIVNTPVTRGSRSDLIVSLGSNEIHIDVKVYSPPSIIEIDGLKNEAVYRLSNENGDIISLSRLVTLSASSLKKASYPSNYNLVFAIDKFPAPEELQLYRDLQELLNEQVSLHLSEVSSSGKVIVSFCFLGKPPVDVSDDYFVAVQSFNLSVLGANFQLNKQWIDDLVKSYKK